MARLKNSQLNSIFLQISKRAERYSDEQLVNTFVNAGLMFEALYNQDHQIIYGRRGTGKTHALRYLADKISNDGDIPIYVDMLRLGSDISIYNDPTLPIAERAVRLLRDVLNEIHDQLLAVLVDINEVNKDRLSSALSQFGTAMPSVVLDGVSEEEILETWDSASGAKIGASFTATGPKVSADLNASDSASQKKRQKTSGEHHYRVRFPDVSVSLSCICALLPKKRFWFLFDEWSSLPELVQPFLADMMRKTFFNIRNVSVKIAAIEHRSQFYLSQNAGQYLGFELGADIGSGINLDDYLVFDNDQTRSTKFFSDLFFRHVSSILLGKGAAPIDSVDELIRNAFTQDRAFDQLVRACEGVPRDAIHILGAAAQKANDRAISIPNIRQAARTFYQTDKSDVVASLPVLTELLEHIIDTVIGSRNTSIFLLEVGNKDENLDKLFDRRILHVKTKNGSSPDHKGKRFVIYKIDYGCYIDLIYTKRFPDDAEFNNYLGTEADDEFGDVWAEWRDEVIGEIEVPQDDKRSYRRAILDLSDFYSGICR